VIHALFPKKIILHSLLIFSQSSSSPVIAPNLSEENKRVHDRVAALTNLSQYEEVFWTNKRKAVIVAKFQDRVHQVHKFVDKCYTGFEMIWKMMFPLNEIPPTLLTLMPKFSNAKKVCKLVRCQLLAGVETTLAFTLSQHPSLDLEAIARSNGDIGNVIPFVKDHAAMIAARLEIKSEAYDST
jgi:hypothetical protein